MIKILNVDDKPMNHEVIRLDIEDYMDEQGIDYEFLTANDGLEAIKKIKRYKPQIVFMDMMMPYLTGAETIKAIRVLDDVAQTPTIMVTALNDEETQQKAREAGANGFIAKPFRYEAISSIFQKYLDIDPKDIEEEFFEDDFIDFGEDEAFADTAYTTADNVYSSPSSEIINDSHQKISASEFLSEYTQMELNSLTQDVDDLEDYILEHIEMLYEDNLDSETEEICDTLEKYAVFLNHFSEFQELSTSLSLLIRQISHANYDDMNDKQKVFIAEYIKAILLDLLNWKKNVFVDKSAIDVFYINASLLSSCIQLESYMKKLK